MPENRIVRIGVAGFGNMGRVHCQMLYENKILNAELTCICDIDAEKITIAKDNFNGVNVFSDYKEMVKSGKCDAVIIAVPHFLHTTFSMYAMNHGLDVLSEKPAAVKRSDLEQSLAVSKKTGKTYAVMLNQRMNPVFKKTKSLVESGFIGTPKRLIWIITNWYRTQGYYDSGDWRASWTGEGGGVLMNQAPHQLDLMQWIFGMPSEVNAFLSFGKWHDIDVEDDCTLFFKYNDAREAVFITTTGEYPGTNRLEISGDLGKIVVENGKIIATTYPIHEREFCKTANLGLPQMEVKTEEISAPGIDSAHLGVVQNFVNHILFGEELVSPASDGIFEVDIANSAYVSDYTKSACTIPAPIGAYDNLLKDRQIAEKKAGNSRRFIKTEETLETNQKRWQVRW